MMQTTLIATLGSESQMVTLTADLIYSLHTVCDEDSAPLPDIDTPTARMAVYRTIYNVIGRQN